MSGETILITRPEGDGEALAQELHARGFRAIHEPLTRIFLHHPERQALQQALLSEPDAVILTSRFAALALALLSDIRDCPLICVGDATAQAAESLGFMRSAAAGGNAERIVDMIVDAYDTGSRFLYISGAHTRMDMDAVLSAHGMEIERIVLYEAVASDELSETVIEQLKRRQIDAATFFSPRAAQIFSALLAKAEISEVTEAMEAFCLSEAVAAAMATSWKAIHVAMEPTLASLVECVDNAFKA